MQQRYDTVDTRKAFIACKIAIGSYKNDWHSKCGSFQDRMYFPTGEIRHVQINQRTIRDAIMQRSKKSLAGVESFNAKTVDTQQALSGFQDGEVVINDGDELWRMRYKRILES